MFWSEQKKYVDVHGLRMAYVERGAGSPVIFLHGNPTSSFLWRDVMPPLEGAGRLIAPDLIGMGDSDKVDPVNPDTYTFETHRIFLWEFLDKVLGRSESVTLVLHDWGSALGFDWANHHRDRVRAIAYMEGIVRPLSGWNEWSESATPIFQALRSPAGDALIREKNIFVERILPGSILRKLSEDEMAVYRAPFQNPHHRWPTLTWPRQIPIGGQPASVAETVQNYANWMVESDLPKLFVNAEPGAILTGAARDFCRTWPNQTEVTVSGSHFIQEDSGAEIGGAIATWLAGLTGRVT